MTNTQNTVAAGAAVDISFSHVQFYVKFLDDVDKYTKLGDQMMSIMNHHSSYSSSHFNNKQQQMIEKLMMDDNDGGGGKKKGDDIVRQLICSFGFRVTGYNVSRGTRSVLVTSKDPSGIKFIFTSIHHNQSTSYTKDLNGNEEYCHFDEIHYHRFLEAHNDRQGVGVLGFKVDNVSKVHDNYVTKHPKLLLNGKQGIRRYVHHDCDIKILEVYAYYLGNDSECGVSNADRGTVLRFIEQNQYNEDKCIMALPGIQILPNVAFSKDDYPAYCDHWVSNVISRQSFLDTLNDVLGFKPKVDFNAGVVAAGEAQIESTVTGNSSAFRSTDAVEAFRDQSQVFLPINNALSSVGHVHGFLQEIGQGVQHIASRVHDLVGFIQRANSIRQCFGDEEGMTFLQIPRSYYGILTSNLLMTTPCSISKNLADYIITLCETTGICDCDGAVQLDLTYDQIIYLISTDIKGTTYENDIHHLLDDDKFMETILRSRYINLYQLLGELLSEEEYLGVVRNKILVDVQGGDILYQIFTSKILVENELHEAPFLEFIQRVCSVSNINKKSSFKEKEEGEKVLFKAGCGGFGIRNFLTLFLSIEVTKAMREQKTAKLAGDTDAARKSEAAVAILTDQLKESNPILTEISNAMTTEGEILSLLAKSNKQDTKTISDLQKSLSKWSQAKELGNRKLQECSAKYMVKMKKLREQ